MKLHKKITIVLEYEDIMTAIRNHVFKEVKYMPTTIEVRTTSGNPLTSLEAVIGVNETDENVTTIKRGKRKDGIKSRIAQHVLGLSVGEVFKPSQVKERVLGATSANVSDTLASLVDKQKLKKVGYGEYQVIA